jgi:hypothetical protein
VFTACLELFCSKISSSTLILFSQTPPEIPPALRLSPASYPSPPPTLNEGEINIVHPPTIHSSSSHNEVPPLSPLNLRFLSTTSSHPPHRSSPSPPRHPVSALPRPTRWSPWPLTHTPVSALRRLHAPIVVSCCLPPQPPRAGRRGRRPTHRSPPSASPTRRSSSPVVPRCAPPHRVEPPPGVSDPATRPSDLLSEAVCAPSSSPSSLSSSPSAPRHGGGC